MVSKLYCFVLKIVLADLGYIEVQYTKIKSEQIECTCHSPKPRCAAPRLRALGGRRMVQDIITDQWGLCEYVMVDTILGGSPVILWISLGGKPKWLPLKFGYQYIMRTDPIGSARGYLLEFKFPEEYDLEIFRK